MKMHRWMALLLVAALIGVLPRPASGQGPDAAGVRDAGALPGRVQRVVDEWFAGGPAPGVTVAVVTAGGEEVSVSAGLARKEPAVPMRPGDRMMSGSIGKTMVAAVMLQLVREGKAGLDEKVSKWLGDREWFARVPNSADLTLRMLMNHTSGIAEHVTSPEFTEALRAEPGKKWKPEELAAFALDKPALFAAGEGWSYADTNYIFVGMIIEKITGRTYEEELRERVLRPRGLRDTYPVEGPDLPGLVSGYTTPGRPFHVPAEVCVDGVFAVNPQFEWTGGGLVTTSLDLARWARALYGGDVLDEEMRKEMMAGVPAKTGPGDRYGLGVQIWRGGEVVGHSGYFPGYTGVMAWYPEKQMAAAVQVNTEVGAGRMRLRELLDRVVRAAE